MRAAQDAITNSERENHQQSPQIFSTTHNPKRSRIKEVLFALNPHFDLEKNE
jgi:hypothetical protein